MDLSRFCYAENVNESTLVLEGKYRFMHLWNNTEGGSKKINFFNVTYKERKYKSARVHWIFAKFSVGLLQEVEQKAFCDSHDMLH